MASSQDGGKPVSTASCKSRSVKGVDARDSGSSATDLVASTANGVGVVARLLNGKGGEIRKKREDLDW